MGKELTWFCPTITISTYQCLESFLTGTLLFVCVSIQKTSFFTLFYSVRSFHLTSLWEWKKKKSQMLNRSSGLWCKSALVLFRESAKTLINLGFLTIQNILVQFLVFFWILNVSLHFWCIKASDSDPEIKWKHTSASLKIARSQQKERQPNVSFIPKIPAHSEVLGFYFCLRSINNFWAIVTVNECTLLPAWQHI